MIFGVGSPKFVYTSEENIETTVLLGHAVVTRNDPAVKKIVHESELGCDRTFIPLGEGRELEIRVNLFRFSNPRSKLQEIMQYKNKLVKLWLHDDGEPYKDSSGNAVLFYIDEATPIYWESLDYKDMLILKFLSTAAVDLSDSTAIVPQLDEITMTNDL